MLGPGAQGGDLPGVRVRGTGFGQRVVALVPDHHEPEVGHGGEHGTARAEHQPDVPARDGQEASR